MEPDNLFRLLDQYKIEATLMRTQSAATKLLDHIDGWQKIYSDDIATIHLRKPGAAAYRRACGRSEVRNNARQRDQTVAALMRAIVARGIEV